MHLDPTGRQSTAGVHVDSDDPVLISLRERLHGSARRWVVGEEQVAWGRPIAATQDHEGNFVILDEYMHSLVTIDFEGQVIGSSGRQGGGPMELRAPSGISIGQGNDLVISQQRGSPIVIARETGQRFNERFRIHSAPGAMGVCTISGTAYLRVNSLRLANHQVAAVPINTAAVPAFFSAPSLPTDPLERLAWAQGHVACSPEAERIVVTYQGLPLVHAFTPEGTLAWEARLDPFTPEVVERVTVQGSTGMRRRADRASDLVHGAVAIPGGMVLVRVLRLAAASLDESGQMIRKPERQDTYIFSAFTGERLKVDSHVPFILYATDSVLLALEDDMNTHVPKLVAYDY